VTIANTGGFTLTLGSSGVSNNFGANNSAGLLTLNSAIAFSADQTWTGDKAGSIYAIVATGLIDANSKAWTKSGVGALRLSGTVSNLGSLNITGGTVSLGVGGGAGKLSSGARIISVSSGALLESWHTGTVLQSTDISSSAISGAGNFGKQGTGTTTLDVANTYTGTTTVGNSAGILRAGVATSAFGNNSAVSIGTSSTLDLNGYDNTIGSLTSVGNVTLGSATLTTGGNNTTTSFSGIISGTGGLTKAGSGVFTLSGANTYTGLTTINAGAVATGATGTFGAGNIRVNTGGTMTLGNATSIADAANVVFDTGATINLNFSGTETINSLSSVSGLFATAGTNYDAGTLNGIFGGTYFTGTGLLTITASAIPEPSTYALWLSGMAGLVVMVRRRKNRQKQPCC
jgi:autotransporter-associated beta strand protein